MTNSPAAADLPLDRLTAALRAGAAGHLPGEAAVALLVEHDVWPRRADFRAFVDYTDDPDATDTPLVTVRPDRRHPRVLHSAGRVRTGLHHRSVLPRRIFQDLVRFIESLALRKAPGAGGRRPPSGRIRRFPAPGFAAQA